MLSCTLDDWTDAQVNNMAKNGNKKVNDLLEFSVPKTIEVPCLSYTDRDTREKYITAKYINLLFQKASGRSPRPPERTPRKGTNNALAFRPRASMVEYIGIVNIHVVECRDLIVKDITSSDPYCVLNLGLQSFKTKIDQVLHTESEIQRALFSLVEWSG